MKKLTQGMIQNIGGPSSMIKHGDDDIFVKNPIFLVFENDLQACTYRLI
jgi:hypothetical protein